MPGNYLRLTDFVYHSTLGLRVIQKKKKTRPWRERRGFVARLSYGRNPEPSNPESRKQIPKT